MVPTYLLAFWTIFLMVIAGGSLVKLMSHYRESVRAGTSTRLKIYLLFPIVLGLVALGVVSFLMIRGSTV